MKLVISDYVHPQKKYPDDWISAVLLISKEEVKQYKCIYSKYQNKQIW
jgi:hypothetical protein